MPEITKEEAKKFLNNISSKDKVAIIHHDDLDGYASGIIFSEFCIKKGIKPKNIIFKIGTSQEAIIKQTKKFKKIIIADLGPNTIEEILEKIKHKEVFYTDHHQISKPIPQSILEYRTTKEGYIPSSRTAYELVGGKQWIAIAGTLADAGHLHEINKQFLDNFFKKTKMTQKQFLEQITFTINKFIIYFNLKPKKALHILLKIKTPEDIKKLKKFARPIEKEIQKYIKEFKNKHEKIGKINFYYFNPKYPIKATVTSALSFKSPHKQFIFATPSKDIIRLSARNQDQNGNMITALKTGIKGLRDASAGGHIPAAGGQIRKEDLERFKENLKKY